MQTECVSRWNTKLLPLLSQQEEVSLYDVIKLASTEYILATKYLGEFIDYFIYQSDNYLNEKQNGLILNFIETLLNPQNFKNTDESIIPALMPFNIKENLSPENYVALHEVFWTQSDVHKLFTKQDSMILQFENCFIFGRGPSITKYTPTFYFQEQFSYFEATCLVAGYTDIYVCKEHFEKDEVTFHIKYPQFKQCFSLLKIASDTGILPKEKIPANKLREYLDIKNLGVPGFTDRDIDVSTNHIHPSIDPTNPNYAPELHLALNVWTKRYIDNYPVKHEEHSPSIEQILEEMGITNKRLIERITVITNNKKLKVS